MSAAVTCYGYAAATGTFGATYGFSARKALTPTVTKTGTWTVLNCSQPAVQGANVAGYSLYATVTATGAASFFTPSAAETVVSESNP